jgi:hypothetical protein
MDSSLPESLKESARYITQGDVASARTLLAAYLKENPSSDDGWLLLSLAVEDPARQVQCLKKALALNPENNRAKQRLASLMEPEAPKPDSEDPLPQPMAPIPKSQAPEPEPQVSSADVDESLAERSATAPWPPPPITGEYKLGERKQNRAGSSGGIYEHGDRIDQDLERDEASTRSAPTAARRKGRSRSRLLWVMGVIVATIFIGTALFVGANLWGNFQANRSAEQTEVAIALATGGAALPPSWTPEPTSTIAPSSTPAPTATITLTPTLMGPTQRELEEISTIQVEVSDLRGLPIQGENPTFIVTKRQVRPVLEKLYASGGGTEQEVAWQKVQLVALGLIKPTYNLFDNILNNIADGIGGFFDPATDEIYVIGTRFGGIEHIIYAHEYDHALVYQNFDLEQAGIDPVCLTNEDACNAFTALVEGDATLLMYQWWDQYASPQDIRDFLTYYQSWAALPEQFPPPFSEKNTNFPYVQGLAFVEYLYDRGNWAEINRVYENPPLSTEQILHPVKYRSGERPILVNPPNLDNVLDDSWQLLVRDTLGEWTTYLMLGYGADNAAQLDDQTAATAAAGWGGDTYLIYHSSALDQTILAAEWTWDSDADQNQFYQAMTDYLDQRFRGARADRSGGDCWEINDQISCLFRQGRRTLWLLIPTEEILNAILNAYPNYP